MHGDREQFHRVPGRNRGRKVRVSVSFRAVAPVSASACRRLTSLACTARPVAPPCSPPMKRSRATRAMTAAHRSSFRAIRSPCLVLAAVQETLVLPAPARPQVLAGLVVAAQDQLSSARLVLAAGVFARAAAGSAAVSLAAAAVVVAAAGRRAATVAVGRQGNPRRRLATAAHSQRAVARGGGLKRGSTPTTGLACRDLVGVRAPAARRAGDW